MITTVSSNHEQPDTPLSKPRLWAGCVGQLPRQERACWWAARLKPMRGAVLEYDVGRLAVASVVRMSQAESWSSNRPRIFIGSANEALDVARTLEGLLAEFARPRVWTRTFIVGQSFIDDILAQAHECEFGLFVMTPHDLMVTEDGTAGVPRDNVLLELGVFLGALGKGRALFVFAGDDKPRLPTDLSGMTAGIW